MTGTKTSVALNYSIQCFKSRAMSMTSTQLEANVQAIIEGQATWDGKHLRYHQDYKSLGDSKAETLKTDNEVGK